MDRITSQTNSAILLESLYYLDKYENERILLYKSLVTANRIKIDFDFSAKLIYISAILPINSVDASLPIESPLKPDFPDWNEEVELPKILSYSLEISSIESEENDSGGSVITITYVPIIIYAAVVALQKADEALPEAQKRKNIQITLDEPNLKAIIEAVLPFESYLDADANIVITPLDA